MLETSLTAFFAPPVGRPASGGLLLMCSVCSPMHSSFQVAPRQRGVHSRVRMRRNLSTVVPALLTMETAAFCTDGEFRCTIIYLSRSTVGVCWSAIAVRRYRELGRSRPLSRSFDNERKVIDTFQLGARGRVRCFIIADMGRSTSHHHKLRAQRRRYRPRERS